MSEKYTVTTFRIVHKSPEVKKARAADRTALQKEIDKTKRPGVAPSPCSCQRL